MGDNDVVAAVAQAVSAVNASASVVSQLSPFELAFGFAQPSRSLTGLRAADALLPPVQAATVQAPPATETQMAALDEQRDRRRTSKRAS